MCFFHHLKILFKMFQKSSSFKASVLDIAMLWWILNFSISFANEFLFNYFQECFFRKMKSSENLPLLANVNLINATYIKIHNFMHQYESVSVFPFPVRGNFDGIFKLIQNINRFVENYSSKYECKWKCH